MRSLTWKLGGALLLIVLVSVGIMAYLTNQKTTSEFRLYVQHGGMMYTQSIADNLGQFYEQKRSWSGVQEILASLPRAANNRLVIADSSGTIVGDTAGVWLGRIAKDLQLGGGTPINASGKEVGKLYSIFPGGGAMMGRGMMGGMAGQGVSVLPSDVAEAEFLSRINSYLWLAGLIAAAAALLLGFFLTRQIIRPIRALTAGAHHIAQGDLGYRVKVKSKDELGELAHSFNIMASSLDKGEQSRRQLVSDVAHELRTPLTIIEGTVDGILDGVFKPDQEHLGSIKEQTAFLTRLVSDLKDLSLAESGQLKLEKTPVNMVELVRRKLAHFEVSAGEKNIQLKLDSQKEIIEAEVDPFRMEQVITNLLTNAIRHTPPGGRITISIKTEHDAKSLLVAVADTGEGIAPEHLSHVFERFYRVEESRARSEGGAGLGLAIVKQMVEAHGGNVRVESEVGKGSTFYIELPLVGPKSR